VKALLDREAKEQRKGGARNMQAIETLLREIRYDGMAAISGDLVAGVAALSAPIFDHRGRIVAAIGVLGRAEDLAADPKSSAARSLRHIAHQVSSRLGYTASA